MIYSPHFRGKRLADLCHRLAISDESGIDIRRAWEREAENARGGARSSFAMVRDGLASGATLADSLRATGNFFPRLFLEMVEVGEKTGGLSAVYHRLSNHYQRGHEMTREFRRRLAWPIFELSAALGVVGVMLWLFGVLGVKNLDGEPIDLLGFGAGMTGVANYVQLLVVAALAVSFVLVSIKREMAWTRPMQSMLIRLPGVGPCVKKICLARMTWALHLTLNVAMDLRQLVPLSLGATGSDYYTRHAAEIAGRIERGRSLHSSFAEAGVFPPHFLDSLQVAEESGQLVESMGRLSKQYDDEADTAMQTLTTFFSFAIWGGVMLLVALMIFKVFSFYVGILNDAANL